MQDDRSLSGFASTAVTITPAATATGCPQIRRRISFLIDKMHPTRLDNVAKAMLDRYADALAANSNGRGFIVGYENAAEHSSNRRPKGKRLDRATQRAMNTKAYLVEEKGIDPRRIELRTGSRECPAGNPLDRARGSDNGYERHGDG